MNHAPMEQPSDEWELVAANEVHVVDALKREGNALFQQRRFLDAIQVYARALAQLPTFDTLRLAPEDVRSLENLEVAVRLNRALAYIELQDTNLLAYAEEDCTRALLRQPDCVKAFYRRALARERLGNLKKALADAEKMLGLEPANPAAHHLVTRLHEAWSSTGSEQAASESELAAALKQHCVVSGAVSSFPAVRNGGSETRRSAAVDVWQALLEDEERLRQEVFRQVASTKSVEIKPVPPRLGKVAKSRTTGKRVSRGSSMVDGEVRSKTESLWAALAEEESTVATIYKRRTGNKQAHDLKPGNSMASSASIHPSR